MRTALTVSRDPDTSGDWICDGTDDATKIQLAIDEASKEGDRVFIRRGLYRLLDPVKIKGENVSLEGEGWGTVLESQVCCSFVLSVEGSGSGVANHARHIALKNLRIRSDTREKTKHGLQLKYTHSCLLDRLWIENFNGYGIMQDEDWELTAQNLILNNNGNKKKPQWLMTETGGQDYTNHSRLFNCAISGKYGQGLKLDQGTHAIRLDLCKFIVWGGFNGVEIDATANRGLRGIILENCLFETAGNPSNGCAVNINQGVGYHIDSCSLLGNYDIGVNSITNGEDVVISNNRFIALAKKGVNFDNRINITGNFFAYCGYALYSEGGAEQNINGNTIIETGKTPIHLEHPLRTNITGNIVKVFSKENPGAYPGIYLYNPRDTNWKGNVVSNPGVQGEPIVIITESLIT